MDTIMASLLRAFRSIDSNEDGLLSMEEARSEVFDLTEEEFDAMDTNNDGFLSRAELGESEEVPVPTGCALGKSFSRESLGDLFLLGLSFLGLLVWRGRL